MEQLLDFFVGPFWYVCNFLAEGAAKILPATAEALRPWSAACNRMVQAADMCGSEVFVETPLGESPSTCAPQFSPLGGAADLMKTLPGEPRRRGA